MPLRQTPLSDAHRRLGARMVDFGGWDMPVQYAGIVEEHRAVRTAAGIFDVSHMGELFAEGPGAAALLQRLTPNDIAALPEGRAHYTSFLTARGTFVDDLLVYKMAADRFMIVANASNVEKDFAWLRTGLDELRGELPGEVRLRDESQDIALLSVQGPGALDIVTSLWRGNVEPKDLKYYGFVEGGSIAGQPLRMLSRTGYTGEDGFELYVEADRAERAWQALLEAGAAPIGLGARDTLRLEAGMCLYGNDIDEDTTPIEAGLQWTVKLAKGDFRGRDVLARQVEQGVSKRLVGLDVTGKGIARHGHDVVDESGPVGKVTSGTHAPTLARAVAMAHVPPRLAAPGTEVTVDIRGRAVSARVTALPFYSRKKK